MMYNRISQPALKSIIIALTSIIIAMSCGRKQQFSAEITFESLPTQNVDVIINSTAGVQQRSIAALDGKLSITGATAQPAVVEMYTLTGTLLGRFVASGGDKITASYTSPTRFTIKGNETSQQLADFLASHDSDPAQLNKAIASFIQNDPEAALGPVMISYFYDTKSSPDEAYALCETLTRADNATMLVPSMMQLLKEYSPDTPQRLDQLTLIIPGDTVATINPKTSKGTILYIASHGRMDDTLALHITDSMPKSFKAIVVHTALDTINWRENRERFTRGDVTFCWAPAATSTPGIDRLHIPQLPYIIAADSTGVITYRGTDGAQALKSIKQRL